MPKSVVINPFFDWGQDRRPRTPWHRTVVYETHVKGFTKTHPVIPEELRGTYAGHGASGGDQVSAAARRDGRRAAAGAPVRAGLDACAIAACATTGATTRSAISRRTTSTRRGQRGEQVQEFKHLVKTMHEAGIEVILDVVYNHTAEGNHLGPVLSLKGLDNAAYYRLVPDNRRYYVDYTGTGNSHEHAASRTCCSSSWTACATGCSEMHVDGFRFDLAATLARELHEVDRLSSFFDLIQQDPDRQPGQAHRRAVGHRRGRLSGRQLPAAVVGVERQVSRHACATSGAAPIGRWPSSRIG